MRANRHHVAISQFSASPIRIADSTAMPLTTGSAPGSPRQTGQTWVLGSAPNPVAQPQNILVAVLSSTWTSRPITGSNLASASSNGHQGSVGGTSAMRWTTSSTGARSSSGPPHCGSSSASRAAPTR